MSDDTRKPSSPPTDSLFATHMRLIETDKVVWSKEDHIEFSHLSGLDLPPLKLSPRKVSALESFLERFKIPEFRMVIGGAIAAIVAIVLIPKLEEDRLSAKGSLQVSVFWERDGKVSPLTDDSVLRDGDKVGAKVISSDEADAYWAITDNRFKAISDASDVDSSRLDLQPGVSKSFDSSFELVAPNQGENLVVVVCPKVKTPKRDASEKPTDSFFDHEFVSRLMSEQKVRASGCVFVGHRLRRLP